MQNNSQFIYSSPNGANTIMKNGPNQEIITTAEGVYMRNGSQTMFIPNHQIIIIIHHIQIIIIIHHIQIIIIIHHIQIIIIIYHI